MQSAKKKSLGSRQTLPHKINNVYFTWHNKLGPLIEVEEGQKMRPGTRKESGDRAE